MSRGFPCGPVAKILCPQCRGQVWPLVSKHQGFSGIVQSPDHFRLFAAPWTAVHQASLSLTIAQSLPKFTSISLAMPSNHLILWCPLLLLPSICPSIRDFSKESVVHIRWLKCWNFIFSISPSNEYSGFISFRIDLLHLFAVQGTLGSSLQHHNSKASTLWCPAFFMTQLSQTYRTAGETIALAMQTCVGAMMSLLFNTLFRFIVVFYQEATVFWLHSCCQHPRWLSRPRGGNLSRRPLFSIHLPWSGGTGCYDLSVCVCVNI